MKVTTYVGSFIWKEGKGIYHVEVDTQTGALASTGLTLQENAAYAAINAAGDHLYSVIESNTYEGVRGGAVLGYHIAPDGALTLHNAQSTQGSGPTHLSLSKDGLHIFCANYGEGTAVCYPLNPDGSIGDARTVLPSEGRGPNPDRQGEPHAHFALQTPDEKFLCVVDLGIDAVMLYPYTKEGGAVMQGAIKVPAATPGAGPRHMVFSQDGQTAYVVCELISHIEVYDYLGAEGFAHKQTLSTLPQGYDGTSYCAAIRASEDGKYIYASNRGHDSVAAFATQPDGRLRLLGTTPTGGQNPRDIQLTPGGKFLLCGNQDAGGITVLRVEADGSLLPTDQSLALPCPVSFAFLPR